MYTLRCVISSFHLEEERELVALLKLSSRCLVTVNVLWLFLTVLEDGIQCVIVVFPDHTQLLYDYSTNKQLSIHIFVAISYQTHGILNRILSNFFN